MANKLIWTGFLLVLVLNRIQADYSFVGVGVMAVGVVRLWLKKPQE